MMMPYTPTTSFKKTVMAYYRKHKRDLPWRRTKNPYHILISEVMLQQTQATRVIEPYTRFIERFPTIASLAEASFKDVFAYWNGLGHNRRARYLKNAAETIVRDHGGTMPGSRIVLESLPGVGAYTAGAILTFAFEKKELLIETNIRTVFIHFFFDGKRTISDAELLPYIERTLPRRGFREWWNALMDYGAMLKRMKKNAGSRSAHYVKQTAFRGSRRELRGQILKTLLREPKMDKRALAKQLRVKENGHDLDRVLSALQKEALITERGNTIALA